MTTLTLPRAGTGLLALFVAFVLGCAALGLETPQTFEGKALVAISTVDEVTKSASTLLNARKISSADAENVIKVGDGAMAGIAIARTIAKQDPAAGQARLTAITTALAALQVYLATRSAAP